MGSILGTEDAVLKDNKPLPLKNGKSSEKPKRHFRQINTVILGTKNYMEKTKQNMQS